MLQPQVEGRTRDLQFRVLQSNHYTNSPTRQCDVKFIYLYFKYSNIFSLDCPLSFGCSSPTCLIAFVVESTLNNINPIQSPKKIFSLCSDSNRVPLHYKFSVVTIRPPRMMYWLTQNETKQRTFNHLFTKQSTTDSSSMYSKKKCTVYKSPIPLSSLVSEANMSDSDPSYPSEHIMY